MGVVERNKQWNKSRFGIFERLKESKKLPPGHYERKRAEEAIEAEYHLCHQQEKALWQTLKAKERKQWKRPLSLEQATEIGLYVCQAYGLRPLKRIVFSSAEAANKGVGGFYRRREIHLPYTYCGLMTLVHELGHHIQSLERMRSGHGEAFLWCERMVWDAFVQWKNETKDQRER